MKAMHFKVFGVVGFLGVAVTVFAEEQLPVLKVGSEVYSNVTVVTVSAADLSILHARGVATVKLKNLSPELQQRFGYDPAKAAALEKQRAESNAEYHRQTAIQGPTNKIAESRAMVAGGDEIQVPELHAKSFLGGRPPKMVVEQWLTPAPNTQGKFVLIDFWATWCGPCRRSIPHLNKLQAKFSDRLVVIGLSNETEQRVRAMTSPKVTYAVALDSQGRMMSEAQVKGIPHALLVDPSGVVRFEGMPDYLTERGLAGLIAKYGK